MPTHTLWSSWRDLGLPERLSPRVLREVLDGGQAFRWHRFSRGAWLGVWASHVAEVRLDGRGRLQWRAPAGTEKAAAPAVRRYFDAAHSSQALTDVLPWRSDAHLARCLQAFPGLRILRQPFEEALLCFICSSAKQVRQIKQIAFALASRHGQPLVRGIPSANRHSPVFHRLPSWSELSLLTESALRDCRLGFRARHVHGAAQFIAAHPGWLETAEAAPYAEAKAMLCQLPGVGEKIADCALLFGAGRTEAFPVDVWILRAMARRYGLSGWKPAQVAQFGRIHFGPAAGLAQQYLFAWERQAGQ